MRTGATMTARRTMRTMCAAAMTAAVLVIPDQIAAARAAADGWQAAPAQAAGVPSDLKPMLAPRISEMRLVVNRYTQDRTTLSCNYANGGAGGRCGGGGGGTGGGGGRNGGGPAMEIVPLSPARLARLKR